MVHAPFPLPHRLGVCCPLWLAAVTLAACADELTLATEGGGPVAPIVTEPAGDGSFITHVDASDEETWVYFSFASGAEVLPADAGSSADWDLAFQRFHILSNGGVSGAGGASVAVLMGASFEEVLTAPAGGYVADQPDDEDDDSLQSSAFESGDGWYDYDPATNRLSPRPHVYVVQTGSGGFYKVQILGYYDGAGTSGHPRFRWAQL